MRHSRINRVGLLSGLALACLYLTVGEVRAAPSTLPVDPPSKWICYWSGCGDGILDSRGSREQCDDGNNVTESCDYGQTSCTVCAADCTVKAGATHYCGDGVVDPANGEECDGGVDCDANCKIISNSVCGDRVLTGSEQCECTDGKTTCDSAAVFTEACLKSAATVCDNCLCRSQ